MKSIIKSVLFISVIFAASTASATTIINQNVLGTANLYNTAFGSSGNPFPEAEATIGATNATAVQFSGSAFNFSGAAQINFSTTGAVQDNGLGVNSITDADGIITSGPNAGSDTGFGDGNFRGLPVYSLIGIFSTTSDVITPLGASIDTANLGDPLMSAFFIGTSLNLSTIPSVPELFLFLAENDGGFFDNTGSYDVTIEVTPVPLPAAFWLFATSILGVMGFSNRSKAVA